MLLILLLVHYVIKYKYSSIYGAFYIFNNKNDNAAPQNAPKNYGKK